MKIVFDYSKLRGRIREKYGTQSKFADAMGFSSTSLSGKLNNAVEFTQHEINKARSLLGIDENEVFDYFLPKKSNKFDFQKGW